MPDGTTSLSIQEEAEFTIRVACECYCNLDLVQEALSQQPVMNGALDYGLFKTYFEHSASKTFDDEREASDYVKTMLGYTVQFIEFLRNCGGCEPVWNNA